MSQQTTMEAAFAVAGYTAPDVRLRMYMRDALKGSRGFDDAVARTLRDLEGDAEADRVMWSDAERSMRVRMLLSPLLREMRAEGESVFGNADKTEATGEGQRASGHHTTGARPSASDAKPAGKGHSGRDLHSSAASPPAPKPKAAPVTQARKAALLEASAIKSRCILDTMVVNGQPLRKVSVEEALGWTVKRQRDCAIIQALCRGKAPTSIIGEVVSDDEAETIRRSVELIV